MARIKKEKEDEEVSHKAEKAKYDAKIKDLEEQIRMLRNESGDILQELERKMQMLIDNHEQEKGEMERDRKKEREDLSREAENRLKELKEDYERKLRELTIQKDTERNDLKTTLDARIRDLEDMLKKERENMEGSAKEREIALKKEIEEWKKKFTAKDSECEDLKSQIK